MERIISATVVAQLTCYKQQWTKRPPSLTLTGARIFEQLLATIQKQLVSGVRSQETGARSQWTKFSWKYDFPTFSEIILLLLYANKNWAHFFSNSEIEVALLSCFGKKYFFYFSCTSNSSEVKPDLGVDQLKGTNKAWNTSRLACDKNSIFFFIVESPFPGGVAKLRTNALPCWHQFWLS